MDNSDRRGLDSYFREHWLDRAKTRFTDLAKKPLNAASLESINEKAKKLEAEAFAKAKHQDDYARIIEQGFKDALKECFAGSTTGSSDLSDARATNSGEFKLLIAKYQETRSLRMPGLLELRKNIHEKNYLAARVSDYDKCEEIMIEKMIDLLNIPENELRLHGTEHVRHWLEEFTRISNQLEQFSSRHRPVCTNVAQQTKTVPPPISQSLVSSSTINPEFPIFESDPASSLKSMSCSDPRGVDPEFRQCWLNVIKKTFLGMAEIRRSLKSINEETEKLEAEAFATAKNQEDYVRIIKQKFAVVAKVRVPVSSAALSSLSDVRATNSGEFQSLIAQFQGAKSYLPGLLKWYKFFQGKFEQDQTKSDREACQKFLTKIHDMIKFLQLQENQLMLLGEETVRKYLNDYLQIYNQFVKSSRQKQACTNVAQNPQTNPSPMNKPLVSLPTINSVFSSSDSSPASSPHHGSSGYTSDVIMKNDPRTTRSPEMLQSVKRKQPMCSNSLSFTNNSTYTQSEEEKDFTNFLSKLATNASANLPEITKDLADPISKPPTTNAKRPKKPCAKPRKKPSGSAHLATKRSISRPIPSKLSKSSIANYEQKMDTPSISQSRTSVLSVDTPSTPIIPISAPNVNGSETETVGEEISFQELLCLLELEDQAPLVGSNSLSFTNNSTYTQSEEEKDFTNFLSKLATNASANLPEITKDLADPISKPPTTNAKRPKKLCAKPRKKPSGSAHDSWLDLATKRSISRPIPSKLSKSSIENYEQKMDTPSISQSRTSVLSVDTPSTPIIPISVPNVNGSETETVGEEISFQELLRLLEFEDQAPLVGSPETLLFSPLVTECPGPDESTQQRAEKLPIDRLLDAAKACSKENLKSAVSDMRAAVTEMDELPGYAYLDDDCDTVAAFIDSYRDDYVNEEDEQPNKKLKRDTESVSMNAFFPLDTDDFTNSQQSSALKPNQALVDEINDTNEKLQWTVITVVPNSSDQSNETIVRCTYRPIGLRPEVLRSMFAVDSINLSVDILIHVDYPSSPPKILDCKLPVYGVGRDMAEQTRSMFDTQVRCVEPLRVGGMAEAWDFCARSVFTAYARHYATDTFTAEYVRSWLGES